MVERKMIKLQCECGGFLWWTLDKTLACILCGNEYTIELLRQRQNNESNRLNKEIVE